MFLEESNNMSTRIAEETLRKFIDLLDEAGIDYAGAKHVCIVMGTQYEYVVRTNMRGQIHEQLIIVSSDEIPQDDEQVIIHQKQHKIDDLLPQKLFQTMISLRFCIEGFQTQLQNILQEKE